MGLQWGSPIGAAKKLPIRLPMGLPMGLPDIPAPPPSAFPPWLARELPTLTSRKKDAEVVALNIHIIGTWNLAS